MPLWRFVVRHPLTTAYLLLAAYVVGLVLWDLLLPSPETHAAFSVAKSLR